MFYLSIFIMFELLNNDFLKWIIYWYFFKISWKKFYLIFFINTFIKIVQVYIMDNKKNK